MDNSCKLSLTIAATVIVLIAAALPTEGFSEVTFFQEPGCNGNTVSYSEDYTCYNVTYTGGFQFHHNSTEGLFFHDKLNCADIASRYVPGNTMECTEITQKSFRIFKFPLASGIRQVTAGN